MKIIEKKEQIAELRSKCQAIINAAKTATRDLTEEEEKEIEELKREIEDKKEELAALVRELDEKMPSEDEEEEAKRSDDEEDEVKEECNKRNKKIRKNKMNKLQYRFAQAVKNREYGREFNMNSRAITVTGEGGTHDALIEEEFTDILEPLYANNILSNLGVQFKTGLPMGDIHVPTMTKGTVGFLGEIDPAGATANEFGYKKLSPHRIAAYVEISEQQLRQDTIGAFEAVQANLLKKLNEYVQECFFSDDAATENKPAGIFYGVTPTEVADYKELCSLEADLEDANVYGDMKYAMNPKAKSAFRSMIKGTNATGMVYDRGEMDGTPAEVTSSIAADQFVYGKWDNVLFATWGDTTMKIDDSVSYINGLIRVYITAFVDWLVLRPEALAFGEVVEADNND